MYCSGCGTQIMEGLNYCSRCGRRSNEPTAAGRSLANNLSMSIGWVGAGGFFFFMFIVGIFAKSGMPINQLIPIGLFYFAALFGICFMILRQIGILAGVDTGKDLRPSIDHSSPNYLKPVSTAQLDEPRDMGIGSVTENTTQTLDKVPVERR